MQMDVGLDIAMDTMTVRGYHRTLLAWFVWWVKVEKRVSPISIDINYKEITLELAVRIPLHNEMKPTSSSKMKHAITTIADYNEGQYRALDYQLTNLQDYRQIWMQLHFSLTQWKKGIFNQISG